MKYVNRIVGKDGVERLYFRKAGLPSVPLKSPMPPAGQEDGSPLDLEVKTLLGLAPAKAAPSTLRAALRAYELDSPDFAGLEDSTKYLYRKTMQELDEDFGETHVSRFTGETLLKMRNAWAERGYRAAAIRLQVLKNALWPAIVAGKLGGGDPFSLIPGVRRPRDLGEPHPLWPEEVVLKVIAGAMARGKPGLAVGVAIGRWAGPRREDITRLTRAARRFDPRTHTRRFAFLSGKRRVQVDMPEDSRLTAVLDALPHNHLILAPNLSGGPYTADGFGLELKKLIAELHALKDHADPAERAKAIDSDDYGIHGLRHTFGVEAALAGCTDAQGAALMGHSSPASFATYRRQADRIRLADDAAEKIAALRERTPNSAVQNELQKLCKMPPVEAAKARGKSAGKSQR